MDHAHVLGGRIGFGDRPARLVVDMILGFTNPSSPLACEMGGAVEAIAQLLATARRNARPTVFTTVAYGPGDERAARPFLEKVPALRDLVAGGRWVQIDPRLAPEAEEPVLTKLFASAFFGTALASLLVAAGADSVLVTGASTSGCVRATVVDALQHGFRPVVAREAVSDRDPAAHQQSLCDMDNKYADVVSLGVALQWLATGKAAARP